MLDQPNFASAGSELPVAWSTIVQETFKQNSKRVSEVDVPVIINNYDEY